MKDGYYYFIPAVAGKTDVDKSLGYVCVTKYPRRSSYSMQCSLSRDAAAPLGVQGTVEIHLSASSYIDEQSILIGKIRLAPKTRLFIDVSLPAAGVESIGPDQYAVVSASGRTLFYSVLEKKHSEGAEASVQTSDAVQAPAQPRQPVPQSGRSSRQSSSPVTQPALPSAGRNLIHLKQPILFINGIYTTTARTAPIPFKISRSLIKCCVISTCNTICFPV